MRRKPEPQAASSDPVNANKKRAERPADASARQSYSSILVNFGKCLLLIVIVPPFINYASLQREGQMLLPKDGQMVDVGLGQKLHLLCKGRGKPAVILDAPTGMSSDVWVHVQEKLSSLTKVCTYDRMGLGFSKRLMQNETTGTEKVWGASTTGRMVDDLHRLLQAAGIATPFVLVGSELGALNSRFYSHIHDAQVSDLVLIDPIPEDVFEEDQWREYWYGKLLPSLQARQFSAATGLSRLLIILGAIEPMLKGENVSEEVIQRQGAVQNVPRFSHRVVLAREQSPPPPSPRKQGGRLLQERFCLQTVRHTGSLQEATRHSFFLSFFLSFFFLISKKTRSGSPVTDTVLQMLPVCLLLRKLPHRSNTVI
ncbi:uncharacterized protein si:dkey-122a22.2 isoform X2 [Gambusia affinis]|uniref:uncharacterized protein si:dkey-122a22.2 isoform X2 n=1 Tax=Gambusia affinis TaxID=33528 RepID=UPI001CDCEAE6|nr:uncharacterized protein si:dkey-122a22.2 isoform X2 [Gambusia affinis]